MIHWIASFPKSGNTWVRLFLAAYLTGGKFDPNIKPLNFPQCTADWAYEKVAPGPLALLSQDEVRLLRNAALLHIMKTAGTWCFVKTHAANVTVNGLNWIPPEITAKSLYIVRDPRDVAISYADHLGVEIDRAISDMGKEQLQLTRTDKIHQATMSWSVNVESWCRPTSFYKMAVKYEDLLADPVKGFREIVTFLELDLNEERLRKAVKDTEFDSLRKAEDKHGYEAKSDYQERFFRKGTSGQWRDVLTAEQIARIEKDHGETMSKWGYG